MRSGIEPRRICILIFSVSLLVAGCLSPDRGERDETPSVGLGPTHLGWDTNVTLGDCMSVIVGYFVDRERAQSFLPDGFTAKDPGLAAGAGDLVLDVTGQATLIFWGWTCHTGTDGSTPGDWLAATIDIERPEIAGMEDVFTTHDVYPIWAATADDAYLSNRTLVGAPFVAGQTTISEVAQPPSGAVRTNGDTGALVLAEGSIPAAVPDVPPLTPDGYHATYWLQTDEGINRLDVYGDSVNRVGEPTACHVAAGTPMAELFGSTTCPDSPFIFNLPSMGPVHVRDRFIANP